MILTCYQPFISLFNLLIFLIDFPIGRYIIFVVEMVMLKNAIL